MAKPYRDGKGYAIRLRYRTQDIYLSGFRSEAEALKAAARKRQAIDDLGKPKGFGPTRTSVGQAMQDYARERLPFLKGAQQEANRLNRYLRTLGLDLIQLTKSAESAEDGAAETGPNWVVGLAACPPQPPIPKSLHQHRDRLAQRTGGSDRLRAALARTMVADVTPHQVQDLLNAMQREGYEAATIGLERALLRVLFNHARNIWAWPEPTRNPATGLKLPKIDNGRDRVLTNGEWTRLSEALQACVNPYVAPALGLLLDTTMRSSEALLTARWHAIDMERCVLRLGTAKAGGREVPLGPQAMAILHQLRGKAGTPEPSARILPISYEALKAAWNRACARAGVEGVQIHDLRHTGATRYALEYHGNVPVLKKITGHKTVAQLNRYINIKVNDVVRMMHGRALSEDDAPAGLTADKLRALFGEAEAETSQPAEPDPRPDNVLRVDFSRRAA
jgi:integrase